MLTEKGSGSGSSYLMVVNFKNRHPQLSIFLEWGQDRDTVLTEKYLNGFLKKRSQGVCVTGKALLVEGQQHFFAAEIISFKASHGWLQKWKNKHFHQRKND